ncbi:MAG: glycerol kinase [Candidatus Aminicenantes bacterium RBG_19FT_COMBO_65_30]|nr:MAG: glycerol kinase [Candidatus Aminicenantes bacterium RBG_19FT_COMBO_65_30]
MSHVLAIDQGTTGSRAIVFDRRGRAVASAYEEFPQYFPRPGWVEHDPEEIWRSVCRTIQKALASVPGRAIAAVGITNQRETTVIWDRKTGRPAANAIVWQCRRTAGRCRELAARPGLSRLIRKKTGLPIDAYFSATKAEWLLDRGGRRVRAARGRLAFGTTDSWVLWKLSGGASHATDPTNASRTMLFNIRRLDWDDDLLRLFGIPSGILPTVLPSSGEFGRTVRLGRLPAGIPIMGIAGDQQAALFGQAGFKPGAIKNTYGTGSFILLNTGRELVESRHGLITTVACGPGGRAVYALEGSVFVAGAALQWLRDQLGLIGSASESEAAAGAVEDNAGVYFVPAFVGLGAPYWDAEARGTIVGLTRGAGRNHLVRAAVEAMAYSTRDVLETMRKESGLKVRELRVDGGASVNDFLCRFQADILGIPVVRPKTVETTSLGAAYLAGLGAGLWETTAAIERLWVDERKFMPAMTRGRADGLYAGWQAAVRKARAV